MTKQQQNNYETLCRKQCGEHDRTFEKMRKYELEGEKFRQMLASEQNAHQNLKSNNS